MTFTITLQAQLTEAPPALTDTQETALDLYRRGMNVLPVRPHTKKPYILEPLFTARLHHCSAACHHKGRHDIAELFRRQNLGVMTGRTSGNLIAVDCDSQESFTAIGKELAARNLPYWTITGQKGGAYLLRVIEGEVSNVPKRSSKIKDVEIWGNRHLIVMPPSIHESGIVYQWVTPEPRTLPPGATLPAVSITALEWLGVALDKGRQWEPPELYGLPEWAGELSHRNRLTYAEQPAEGSRNNSIFALACDMKGVGVEYHEAERVILDIAKRASTPRREALSTLKSAYKKDREPARKGGGLKEWQRAKVLAESFDWRATFGRRALRRRAVYLACVERARLDGRVHWRATAREIAELANTSAKRAAEGLQDLTHAGLIRRVNAGREAGVYRFTGLSQLTTLDKTGSYSVVSWDTPKTHAEQDVFRSLGLVAWHVWRYLLLHEVRSAGEIARATGLPRSSVHRALKVLTRPFVGLVWRDMAEGGIFYGEGKTDGSFANMAAAIYDGASPSKAREELHRLERELRVNDIVTRKMDKHAQSQEATAQSQEGTAQAQIFADAPTAQQHCPDTTVSGEKS